MKNTYIQDLSKHGVHQKLIHALLNMNNDIAAMRQNVMKIADAYVRLVEEQTKLYHILAGMSEAHGPDGRPVFDLAMTTAAREKARQMNVSVASDPHMNGEADDVPTSPG